MSSVFSLENDAFASLVIYGSLGIVKTALMSLVTARFRMKHHVPPTPEDVKYMHPNNLEKQKAALRPNEDIERVRRAHRNDLENVIPFVLLGLLYVSTKPDPITALWHFRAFLGFRILHSIAYVNAMKTPIRGLGFLGGMAVFVSMAYHTIIATYKYL